MGSDPVMIIGNAETVIKWLFEQADRNNRDKLFEIKEKRNRRSLTQNAYSWVLIGEIADKLRLSKEEVYLRCLRDYGQSIIVSLREDIDPSGYIKYYDEIGTGEVNGKSFKHYRAYKGTSELDSREMSVFIDGVISEARNLGIPTLSSEEAKRLNL